jgi:RNA polymerase-binding transcription factor DksA
LKSREELHYIQQQITKASENGTADTENRFGGMEDGAGTLEREYLNQMASRAGSFIEHLEKALMRIENKTYGICTVTGKLISKERLRAVPHATKSLEAKEMGKG